MDGSSNNTSSIDNSRLPEGTDSVDVNDNVGGDANDDEEEDLQISIQTNNTFSSLRNFVSKDAVASKELLYKVIQKQRENKLLQSQHSSFSAESGSHRTSAFEPDLPLECEPNDFYRVERQLFKRITTTSHEGAPMTKEFLLL